MSFESYSAGDWVKLLILQGGDPTLLSRTHAAKVTRVRRTYNELLLDLYSSAGTKIYESYVITREDAVAPFDGEPEFKPLLADIPDTPEIIELKKTAWEVFMRYGRSHGYDRMVRDALKELGIQKPNGGTVTATFTFTFTGPVEEFMDSDSINASNFMEHWGNVRNVDKLRAVLGKLKHEDVAVETTVTPTHTPYVAPATEAVAAQ